MPAPKRSSAPSSRNSKARKNAPTKRATPSPASEGEFYFDATAADRACEFIETLHLRAEDGGEGGRLELLEWQRAAVRAVHGWKLKKTGRRRYRRASIWIPRGNGKTPFGAALMLSMMFSATCPQSAELYTVAADREQAEHAFEDAKHMTLTSPLLAKMCVPYRRELAYLPKQAKLKVLSSEAKGKHGSRPYIVLFDELHTQKGRELWKAIRTGLGKGDRDTLLITISTAGLYDPESLGYKEYEYAKKVFEGTIEDPHFLSIIYEAPSTCYQDGTWRDETLWHAVNPGLGKTIQLATLRDEARNAENDAAALADFLQLRLNIWVQAQTAAIAPTIWEKNTEEPEFEQGQRVYLGMDIGEKDDLTAIAMVGQRQGVWSAAVKFFMPPSKMHKLAKEHRVPYPTLFEQGHIIASGVNYVNTEDMEQFITEELAKQYDIVELAFDPWNAYRTAERLQQEGVPTVEMPQTSKHLSEATKDFLDMLADGKWRLGKNPLLRWMASNLVLYRDGKGNVVPQKQSKVAKVDGLVAIINAYARARIAETTGEGDVVFWSFKR